AENLKSGHWLMNRRLVTLTALAAALMLATAGCMAPPKWGEPSDLKITITPGVKIPERPVIVFFADGVTKPVFERLLADGKLPYIKKYIVDRGATVEHAITSLPTITYGVTVSLMTGRFPGHHGVLGNKWYDRHRLIFRDYLHPSTMRLVNRDFHVPTIYELLPDKFSVAILTQTRRGATHFYENWMRSGIAWFFRLWTWVDSATIHRFQNTSELASAVRAWPDLVMAYFPACDQTGHVHGPGSGRNRDALVHLDLEIGNLLKALEREGVLDKFLLVFVTDHGLVPTPRIFDINRFIEKELKIRATHTADEPAASYRSRWQRMRRYRAVCAVDAGRSAKLYFRLDDDWTRRPTLKELKAYDAPVGQIDLLAQLLAHDAVGWICHSNGDGEVRVFTRKGEAVVRRRIEDGVKSYSYTVVKGEDPFGFASSAAAAALAGRGFHSADKWLRATLETAHPDVVGQLPEMFDSPRVGDLVCFARAGWGFGPTPKSMLIVKDLGGGHGGILRDEIIVPWYFAGPGISPGTRLDMARTVSLTPTLLEYIGTKRKLEWVFDGPSILGRLMAGGKAGAKQEITMEQAAK
ncbi:MAG: alkaline phosphatase family protein, partial [Phycisphaerae bacterium]|nr:alkaline phosphatase family protein [Phycisphaerae bacterium]